MAGANISGDLKNPRKSIPVGTLAAIALSLVIYMLLAWWLSTVGTPKELAENYTIMIDKAAWGPIVLGGLLGATFSSALSSIVGAPRILQAIAEHRVIPLSKWFEKKSKRGEPRNAMLMTGSIVMGVILLRDLNAIAPLITMFFLITYTMINMVVVLEQSLGLVSFRPLFRIPRFVPILGTLGCIFAMFIVNATFSLIAVSIVLALYVYLIHKHLKAPFADVRSGLFAAMAEWAAKKVQSLAGKRERAWKANILLPVEKPGDAQKLFGLLRDISYPKGFIRLLGLTGKEKEEELSERLEQIAERFRESGVFSSWTVVDAATFGENLVAGMEALSGAFFQSNVIFLNYPETDERKEEFKRIVRDVKKKKRGVLMLADPQKVILKEWKNIEKKAEITVQEVEFPQIYVYIEKPERGWEVSMDLGNMDLAILIAYKLKLNWDCELNLIAQTEQAWEKEKAVDYLRSISELARISGVKIDAKEKGTTGKVASPAISVFQLEEEVDFKEIDNRIQMAGGPCLFAMDSGLENALA
jgi:adenylate kinase family enzyme